MVNRFRISFFITALLLLNFAFIMNDDISDTSVVEGATVHVPGTYSSVQDAIDNATAGDIVRIGNGTYMGNMIVNKTITLIGNSTDSVWIIGDGTGPVISVTSPFVNISGISIHSTTKTNGAHGIYCTGDDLTVRDVFVNNTDNGIYLYFADGCRIVDSELDINNIGSYTYTGSDNEFSGLVITDNPGNGIQLANSGSGGANRIHDCVITGNGGGSTETAGVFLWGSGAKNNIIEDNLIDDNLNGIECRAWGITGNIFRNNIISNSTNHAIRYTNSAGPNVFYHNSFIDNSGDTIGTISSDEFDEGPLTGGNYWDGYSGSDSNGDGIGDSSYSLSGGAADNYPWMRSGGWNRVKNNNTGVWYSTIQEAVENATNGDTILPTEGNYYENFRINSSITLKGSGNNRTIITVTDDQFITIDSDNVTITGLTFFNCSRGIRVDQRDRVEILKNHFFSVGAPLWLAYSNNCLIDGNSYKLGTGGISLSHHSGNNEIKNNMINSNSGAGIEIFDSDFNTITGNSIINNSNRGIYILDSTNLTITGNNIRDNNWGIQGYSPGSSISYNEIISNNVGLQLGGSTSGSNDMMIFKNNMSSKLQEMYIDQYCQRINISDNTINGRDLTVHGSQQIIANNEIESLDRCIITSATDSLILNNDLIADGREAIYILNSGNDIIGNHITSYWNGIRAEVFFENSRILNNVIDGCGANGIHLTPPNGRGYGILIEGNIIRSCERKGIELYSTVQNSTIIHNYFINNTVHAEDRSSSNDWNGEYPDWGNYWDSHTSTDHYSGPNQDLPGGDGIGDTPYMIQGVGGAVDNYPLMSPLDTPSTGDIMITSHSDGEVISGKVLLEADVTAVNVMAVEFHVNGTLEFTDTLYPYQLILDTSDHPEDGRITVMAVALLKFNPDINTSVSLLVNNRVDTGSYISVETGEDTYHPDQMVTASISTTINTPSFDTVALRVNYNSPSGPIYFVSNNTYPESVQWVVTFPLPSDAEVGNYFLNVTAFGYMKGDLLWIARDTFVFSVSGQNLNDILSGVSGNITDIVNWAIDLSYQNMTLNEILDRVKVLQNDVGYLNSSASAVLGDIVRRIDLTEVNLTHRIDSLDSSMQMMFALAADSILSGLNEIGAMISMMDANVTELGLDLEAHDMATRNRIDELEVSILDDMDSLTEYLGLRMDQMSTYLQVLNHSLQSRMDDIEQRMDKFRVDVNNDLREISIYLVSMNETTVSRDSDILSAIDSTNLLLQDLEDATINGIEGSLLEVLEALEDINSTEAQRHSGTVRELLVELGGVNSSISNDLEQIDLTLAALSKLDGIISDMENLGRDVEKGDMDLDENDGSLKVLIIVSIIILSLILVLVGALVLMRFGNLNGARDPVADGNTLTRPKQMK